MRSVVIVGAGLGGLRAAESLRSAGYTDSIVIVGDEVYLPYNRPPLSKEALAGGIDVEGLEFRRKASVDDVEWLLGTPVAGCDLSLRTVTLSDGATLEFDGLVVATGIRPRRLPIPGPTGGRYALRTATDALAVREHLKPGAAVIIMGAGFIGCEVAATAIKLGCTVHVVALDEEPMVRPLGLELGAAMRRRHEAQGVRFHLGRTIVAFSGDDDVRSATLSDGTELKADLVIEAVGSVANTEWLAGNDLDLSDGLLTDSAMQVPTSLAPVVAVGDLARHPNGLFGHVPRSQRSYAARSRTALHSLVCQRSGQISTRPNCSHSACRASQTTLRSHPAVSTRHASSSTSTPQVSSASSASTEPPNWPLTGRHSLLVTSKGADCSHHR